MTSSLTDTGYIGTRLVPRLLAAGYRVRCLVRAPRTLGDRPWASHPGVEIVQVDLEDDAGLTERLTGCVAAFYLVHSMQSAGGEYVERDRTLARLFATSCAAASVGRLIYLGGLGHAGEELSAHLRSRREVETILRAGPVPGRPPRSKDSEKAMSAGISRAVKRRGIATPESRPVR